MQQATKTLASIFLLVLVLTSNCYWWKLRIPFVRHVILFWLIFCWDCQTVSSKNINRNQFGAFWAAAELLRLPKRWRNGNSTFWNHEIFAINCISAVLLCRVFRLVLSVLWVPLWDSGMVVNYIPGATYLDIQNWGSVAPWWREFRWWSYLFEVTLWWCILLVLLCC